MISQYLVDEVNKIGRENNTSPVQKKSSNKAEKEKFANWFIGLVLSLIPILTKPVIKMIAGEAFKNVVLAFWGNVSILFVGVSIMVSALNDLKPDEKIRSKLYMTFLFLCVFFYSCIDVFMQLKPEENVSNSFIILLNVAFFFIAIASGLQQYFRDVRR